MNKTTIRSPYRPVWPTNFIGKPLTDARIRHYEAKGRYGPTAQKRAIARANKKVKGTATEPQGWAVVESTATPCAPANAGEQHKTKQ